jgi:hypothetical protein
MKLRSLFHSRKSRKYPIKRDAEGRSLRERCFEEFGRGKRPTEVAEELKMKETTVYRYYRHWQRLGPDFEQHYSYVKSLFNKMAPDRDKNIELFAKAWGFSKEQFENILSQSHGLRGLMTRKLRSPAEEHADHKRHMALELALLISEHLIKNRGQFQDVYLALKRYMERYMKYRDEEDAGIKKENEWLKLVRTIIAADLERERQGRVKPDTFSEEERNVIIKWGIELKAREAQIWYWLHIGSLMAEGLTTEQAREKMYQDLIEKGNQKAAEALRAFQDKIHPLKKNDQAPPPLPDQPSSSSEDSHEE